VERKLASIQIIKDLQPITGADAILCAKVLGYELVVKRSEFSVGDSCVFFEIDSIIPNQPWSSHLCKDGKPLRVRTIKLRGTMSQGVALPTSCLPVGEYLEGQDVTDLIGVKKWEPYIPPELTGKVKGTRPSWIPKTDEPRCLDGDVLILTENGQKSIREICENKYSGTVISFNEISGELEQKKITNHIISKAGGEWYEIEINGVYKLRCTGSHLVYIPDLLAYRRVDQLTTENNVLYTHE
jgi:RNA ligase (TIGR02306 family)